MDLFGNFPAGMGTRNMENTLTINVTYIMYNIYTSKEILYQCINLSLHLYVHRVRLNIIYANKSQDLYFLYGTNMSYSVYIFQ